MEAQYLFTYGLFRDSGKDLLSGSKFCGKSTVNGRLYYVNEFYPGIKRGSDHKVLGDLYLIDPSLFGVLDEYEGDEYLRTKIETDSGIECWIYEYKYDVDGLKEIKSGDWMLRNFNK